jgi:hypothetical protein
MDFGFAILTFKAAEVLVWVLFLSGLIERSALRAGKYNRGLGPAGHPRNMRQESLIFQPAGLPQSK